MILADANLDVAPNALVAWIGCAAFLAVFFNQGMKIIDRIRGASPKPPNEQLQFGQDQIVQRVASLEGWRNELTAKMEQDKTEIIAAGEKRAHDIHTRLNPAAENIAEVKGQMTAFTQAFENFTKIIVAISDRKK